jgi:hypothetical protein
MGWHTCCLLRYRYQLTLNLSPSTAVQTHCFNKTLVFLIRPALTSLADGVWLPGLKRKKAYVNRPVSTKAPGKSARVLASTSYLAFFAIFKQIATP